MALTISPCRSLCAWQPARACYESGALLACAGCGSQWAPSEPWTPRNADGTVPAVVAELVTSARCAAAADSAGS